LEIWVRAMVLADETLFAAGAPIDADGDPALRDTNQGGQRFALQLVDVLVQGLAGKQPGL
jgi:hypothetical protein